MSMFHKICSLSLYSNTTIPVGTRIAFFLGGCCKKPEHKSIRIYPTLRGFTLIELLVVIAIIALLVSILLPSLAKAKELAQKVVCSSQLHHIGLAVILYGQENNNFFPPAFKSDYSEEWPNWIFTSEELYANSNKNKRVTQCPSIEITDLGFLPPITYGYDFWHKGYVLYPDSPFISNRLEETFSPSGCPVVCCASGYLVWANDDSALYGWTRGNNHPEYPHAEQSNLVFVDGHVASMLPEDLEREDIWELYPGQVNNTAR